MKKLSRSASAGTEAGAGRTPVADSRGGRGTAEAGPLDPEVALHDLLVLHDRSRGDDALADHRAAGDSLGIGRDMRKHFVAYTKGSRAVC